MQDFDFKFTKKFSAVTLRTPIVRGATPFRVTLNAISAHHFLNPNAACGDRPIPRPATMTATAEFQVAIGTQVKFRQAIYASDYRRRLRRHWCFYDQYSLTI